MGINCIMLRHDCSRPPRNSNWRLLPSCTFWYPPTLARQNLLKSVCLFKNGWQKGERCPPPYKEADKTHRFWINWGPNHGKSKQCPKGDETGGGQMPIKEAGAPGPGPDPKIGVRTGRASFICICPPLVVLPFGNFLCFSALGNVSVFYI